MDDDLLTTDSHTTASLHRIDTPKEKDKDKNILKDTISPSNRGASKTGNK